jgi:hypothetical protein
VQQAGGRHEGISDRLDLFESVSFHDFLEGGDQGLELADDPLRRVAVAVFREAHDIAQQHGYILVPPRLRPAFRLEVANNAFRQEAVVPRPSP